MVSPSMKPEPIAIIGTGCRFPAGCDTPSKLWELLREPRDVLSEIPETRFDVDKFYHPDNVHHGTSNVRHSYLLEEDLRRFDASFFGIKPIEANAIDPQQRLLLETVYESLEAAGLSIKQLQGSDTAVYVGVMSADYTDLIGRDVETYPTYFATGTARSILSNRLSYFFDWHGPSMTIDTACSSSLYALHHAVRTLRSRESSVAVVAGSNIILGPEQYIAESKLQMLSPSGRSRMWDADADGYARGEGVAAIVLKRLSQAIADGDHIECVVRETGLNQDGRSKGITMPSATAQAALIQATYAKAGLDLSKRSDRPQYFEAHGTGTPAGDPIEAEAISIAFFGPNANFTSRSREDTLYVGSIKTVIGHTEGTAGLAAVIKGSLVVQSGVVPPNLLLNRLNPKVAPFYDNLEILSAAQQWPKVPGGTPRRVSVNSFGFGGANSHAILESYEPSHQSRGQWTDIAFTPFTFSAASENALASILQGYRDYLIKNSDVSMRDLSWTLNNRRSTLPSRLALSAANVDSLRSRIDAAIEQIEDKSSSRDNNRFKAGSDAIRILGIFTGQGAQWARMGAELIEKSPGASKVLDTLDLSLSSLPVADRPSWSLRNEILARPESSRIGTASISQPVCTAIQIILVELLRHAGIEFSAVVGHSSGEIGAAYAAGYLTAKDAIRVAYYRGLHLKSVRQSGSMMAVGTSFEDAKELCEVDSFAGRICVAASNSPASVTISGDTDAIEEAKVVFDTENKFTRILKVDRAYHSHHMQLCVKPYIQSLRQCKVAAQAPQNPTCQWISSVYIQDISEVSDSLNDIYWSSNLAQPVMFAEALEKLLSESGPYNLAIEVGPHPALKGPASQIIQDIQTTAVPYTGVLNRGSNDIEAFADALGSIWSSFEESVVDFSAFDRFAFGAAASTPKLLKGLPRYQWDHHRQFWHESRLSKVFRSQKEPPHELLGRRSLDNTPDLIRWRNILRPREIEWLHGHQVQSQMVFPCAGYVSAAVEAALRLGGSRTIQSIELENFSVGQAVVFDEDDSEVEIQVTLTNIVRQDNSATARFSFYSSPNSEMLDMVINAGSLVRVVLGDAVADVLPPKPEEDFGLLDVEPDRFYSAMAQLGFQYTGPFRAMTVMKRKLGLATGLIANAASVDAGRNTAPLLIHPATLDAAIQSIMLAYCYPGDSMLRSIYLPTGIERLTVNPLHCAAFAGKEISVPFESIASTGAAQSLSGDVSIYTPDGMNAIQLEGLKTKPLSNPTEETDLNIFTELVWDVDRPNRAEVIRNSSAQELDGDLLFSLERVAYFYLKTLDQTIHLRERGGIEWHHKRLFTYVDHVLSRVSSGKHPWAQRDWADDSKEIILDIMNRYPDNIDLRLMHAVGENLPAVVRGQMTMLEPMLENNMLNDFYVIAHGMPLYTDYLARMAGQIAHRYPQMKVLEIGAGTGGATKSFLKQLGTSFSSYTFTDISSGFFEKAVDVFAAYSSKMTFKVLDIEKDIEPQGFADGTFDVIIASLVLHATRNLRETVQNVRRLLKPGGYLLLLEITENEQMRFGLIFGGLAGWWLGYDDGRRLSPCIGLEEWSTLLKENGFSGIDTAIPHHDTLPVPLSIIAAQAVDEKIEFLREPLGPSPWMTVIPQLTVIQGGTKSAKIAAEIGGILVPRCGSVRQIQSLVDLRSGDLPVGGTVLCLSDLDEPLFKHMNAEKLRGFQEVFKQSKNVLWVTRGSRYGDPFARMVVGFGRTLVLEMPHLRLQFLDVASDAELGSQAIVETLLRLEITGSWEQDDSSSGLLHSVEPEILLQGETYFIPRFKPNKSQNERYNSGRRTITEGVDLHTATVDLVHSEGSYSLRQSPFPVASGSSRTVVIDVSHTINRAVEVLKGCYLFPVLGRNQRTGEQVIALSPKQASRVRIPTSFVWPERLSGRGKSFLGAFYTELLAHAALRDVPPDSEVVVFEPEHDLAKSLSRIAKEKEISLLFMTGQRDSDKSSWIYIHPSASKHAIQRSLPKKAACFLTIGGAGPLSAKIRECFAGYTELKSPGTLTSLASSSDPSHGLSLEVQSLLIDIKHGLAPQYQTSQSPNLKLVSVNEIGELTGLPDKPILVDWEDLATLPVQVQPIHGHVSFRGDRTYWLVGLTGGLGLSLCEWMIGQGARYVAVTSRNPRVDERWLEKMKGLGATIKIAANDITNRDSVRAIYAEIVQEMPPVAGVAQGAMVLHDSMFLDLDMERLEKVLKPKVNGSIYLEEIFADRDLDFMVYFSSMASVTGNPGQSAYAAANMFMSSLATQRRQRGLNASAVHIGAIFGNGYVTRELTLQQQETLRRVGNLWLSEHDFHSLFAEAVFAGRHERGKSLELSTGLKIIDIDEQETITWYSNPMFQHCIKGSQDAAIIDDGVKSAAPVKAQLLEATSPAEVSEIITDAFVSKLKTTLQVEEERDIVDLAADSLGIDSLVAVDIRSWFIKELQVDIPVLKILSAATVSEILIKAQELLPAALTPNLDGNAEGNPPKPKQKSQPKSKPVAKSSVTASQTTSVATDLAAKPLKTAPKSTPQDHSDKRSVGGSREWSSLENDNDIRPAAQDRKILDLIQDASFSPTSGSRSTDTEMVAKDNLRTVSLKSSSSSTSWTDVDDFERKETDRSTPSSLSDSQIVSIAHDVKIKRSVPMSFAQSRFWFLNNYLQDPTTFNITVSIRLDGPLNVSSLERAVKAVGQRHEALRTRFRTGETHDVVQEVLATSTLHLEIRDIKTDQQAEEEYQQMRNYRFKLGDGESMRMQLFKRSSTSFQFIIGYHHINMDGVSLEVILRDLHMAYDSKFLNPRILQYPDFSERQRREFNSGAWEKDLAFWREEFPQIQAPIPLLPLAKTSSRPTLTAYSTNRAEFVVDSAVQQNIQAACRKLKVTPFHFYLTIFNTLLSRVLDDDVEDICVGVSSANRSEDALQSVGLYLNLLPLRFHQKRSQTFTNALKAVRDKSIAAFSHGKVPFDVVLNELGVPRSVAHSPLFQVFVNYRPGVSQSRAFCDCESTATAFESGQAPYDLSLDVIDSADDDCHVILAGQSVLYDSHAVNTLKDIYANLLASFARNPALRLSTPSLYAAEEVERAIRLGRGPTFKYQWPDTIPHRIDMIAHRYASKTALQDGQGKAMTYSEMTDRVHSIAVTLSAAQIGHGSRVGVFQDPGVDWICSLLAILRLDAAYVPLDPRVSQERLAVIVEDCKLDVIIFASSHEKEWKSFRSRGQGINVDLIAQSNASSPRVPNAAKPDSIAVIAYTSGSTGIPKGIMMKHSSFRNNVEAATTKWYFREGREVTLQQSSYSFDMSICQIFLTLSNGGTLHVVPKPSRGDPAAIASIIAREGITFTAATPSEYVSWLRYGSIEDLGQSRWRIAVSGGEMVTDKLAHSFRQLGISDLRLIDSYGPTEITFCSSSREILYQDPAASTLTALGLQTWPNYSVCIVDANMKAVPIGVPGEVLIGGAGIVAGYLHSEADSQSFLRDRFASPEFVQNRWTTLHRTGDFGRLSDDGSLILGGRIAGDTQIKLRGLRIDLREVESSIIEAAGGDIVDAAVSLRESEATGSEFLVAFVTTSNQTKQSDHDLQEILRRLPLPQYMRPAAVVPLDRMPMSASNKIDRSALKLLPLPQNQQKGDESVLRLNATEARLKDVWEEVISGEVASQYHIGPESDFFHVGGNSMLLVQLQVRIQAAFQISLPLFDLFEASTLGGIAALIASSSSSTKKQEVIDWESETQVSVNPRPQSVTKRFFTHPEVVILTGATGFLGTAIVNRLLNDDSVQKIHCVAVRRDPKTLPEIFRSPKVIIHKGDLTSPRLGLTEREESQIFSEAHAVIHNGADVSFMKSYHSLRATNLDATKELVRMSIAHQLSFHYISTASVTHLTGQESVEESSVSAYAPPTDGSEGYIASKWASERYLEKISDQGALPVWIHRPSSITGEGAPETDLMTNLLRYARLLQALPDTVSWSGWLDFISVDDVAMQIADEVYKDYSWPGTVNYVFESGGQEIPFADLKGVLERENNGVIFEQIPLDEWLSRAQAQGLHPLLTEYLRNMSGVPLLFPRLLRQASLF